MNFSISVQNDGSLTAKRKNPAVPKSLIHNVHQWMLEGASVTDVIIRLRQHTVPHGYSSHTWVAGKQSKRRKDRATNMRMIYCLNSTGRSETEREMLCSILAQLEYQHQIMEWEARGVPFRSHAYVPEVHPLTETVFHEREDEGHVFKVRNCKATHHCFIVEHILH